MFPGAQFARDFSTNPYSDDEKRIVNWLMKLSPDIGGGEDPIGFFMASYEYLIHERKELKRQIAALQLDNDRLYSLSRDDIESPHPDGRDLTEDTFQNAQEWARRGKAAQDAVNDIIEKAKK